MNYDSGRTTEDTRAMLKQIVDFINVNDLQSVYLWDILAALRGPDTGNDGAKNNTTSRIRGAIGIIEGDTGHFLVSKEPLMFFRKEDPPPEGTTYHFMSHYHMAVSAIKKIGL